MLGAKPRVGDVQLPIRSQKTSSVHRARSNARPKCLMSRGTPIPAAVPVDRVPGGGEAG